MPQMKLMILVIQLSASYREVDILSSDVLVEIQKAYALLWKQKKAEPFFAPALTLW
jgi:hypothetical protein